MPSRTFDVSTVVGVAPEVAIGFLADLSQHRSLHPYLVEARVTAEGESDEGPWTQWRVHERPRLGPLRYSIRFGARLTRTSPTSFTAHVLAAPGCTIEAITSATPGTDGKSLVAEQSLVTAPRLLLPYMAHQAELAHTRTFQHLPEVLT